MPDPELPIFRVFLLGAPHHTWGKDEYILSRRQVRALLYRLAVESRFLTRSYLSYLFWGNLPERSARRNLSRILTYLDRALPVGEMLLCEAEHVFLSTGRLWVDTRACAQYWESWLTSRSARDLQMIVDLSAGEFLTGFELPECSEYSAWIQGEAAFWVQRYLQALELLVEVETEHGNLSAAIQHAQKYLQHDELAEAMHRRLIRLYAVRGDRMAGIRQYEQCLKVLERELGVQPERATQEIYQELLCATDNSHLSETPAILWPALPSLPAPFVGRQASLSAMEQALACARFGQGGLIFIQGEPGIGKSRLIKEFASRMRLRLRVIFGAAARCTESSPYQPLVEALRMGILFPGITNRVAHTWLAEAARLLPELHEMCSLPRQPLQLDPEAAQARLFEALFRILINLIGDGYTLLVCLEDLQWADASTLDWLAYAGRRLVGNKVLVVGSFRDEESPALSEKLLAFRRITNFTLLELEGLEKKEVMHLCAALHPDRPPPTPVVNYLHQVSGGNPFYLLEVMRASAEGGQNIATILEPGQLPIPASIKALVGARVAHLSALGGQILEAGAVLGLSFTFISIHQTAGRREGETLDGLDELVARQFFMETDSGYRFCHEISREAVYAGLSYWRKRRLHARAAKALEKLSPTDWPVLAWQFECAGEPQRAAGYAIRAGQAAKALFAHAQARAYFERALEMLAEDERQHATENSIAANHRLRIQALYERGWVLRLLGEMEAYEKDLDEVAGLAEELGDTQALAHLYWQQAYNQRWFCRYAQARQAAERGLELARLSAVEFLEAACTRELGLAARETGNYTAAEAYLLEANELFRHLEQPVYVIHTCGNLATLYSRCGKPDQAHSWAQTALGLCERHGLDFEKRLPLGDLGVAEAALGNRERAGELLLASLEIARQISDRTQEIFCQGHQGWLALHAGDILGAFEYFESALALAKRVGSLSEQSWLQAGLAEAALMQGERARTSKHAHIALELARRLGRRPDEQRAEAILIRLA